MPQRDHRSRAGRRLAPRPIPPLGFAALLAALLAASPLSAQAPDTSATRDSLRPELGPVSGGSIDGLVGDRLPADRVEELLRLQPGVTGALGDDLVIRGAGSDQTATYVDAIPVTPGFRGAAAVFGGRPRPARLEIGTRALAAATTITGVAPARFGSAAGGVVSLFTRSGGTRWEGAASYERDGMIGAGFGRNRIETALGGPIGPLRFFGSFVVDGQESAERGAGADTVPVFVDAGVDTTVTEFDAEGNPFQREVRAFAVARGDCDVFAKSRFAPIAENYGRDCEAWRTPASSSSRYQAVAKLEYVAANGGRVTLSALASQDQARRFDYAQLYNLTNQWGRRDAARMYSLSWRQPIGTSLLEAYVSRQRDRLWESPFDPEHVPGTGTLGLYVKPYEFRYDDESFPLDSALVAAYRSNQLGVCRTICPEPADPARFGTIDVVRNNAYGIHAFTEAGGPDGRINLLDERRLVGGAHLTLRRRRGAELRLGAEATRYEVRRFSHQLLSQALSDAFFEKPRHAALFAENVLRQGGLTIATALRYDRFESNAERAYTITASGDTLRTVRITSFPANDPGLTLAFIEDERHSALSPSIRIGFTTARGSELRAAYGQRAQVPDFAALFAGINTDFAITNPQQAFGTDLDLIRTRTAELGYRQRIGRGTSLDLAGFLRTADEVPATRLTPLFDPLRGTSGDVRTIVGIDPGSVKGFEARLDQSFGPVGFASVGYGFVDAPESIALAAASPVRRHNVTATLALTVAGQGRSTDGLFATFRWASGAMYRSCADAGNEGVLSDEPCASGGPALAVSLPAFKQLDLRLTRTFGTGDRGLTLFLDVRNVLNTTNVHRVFARSGDLVDPDDAALGFAVDSVMLARQAQENGVYDASTGAVDLRFGGPAGNPAGCDGFLAAGGASAAADCVYLVRAEQRFGNGDGLYTTAEQRAASAAAYLAFRGPQELTGAPRTIRLGAQLGF